MADPDLQIRGGGGGSHPEPEMRAEGEGGWSLGPQFGLNIRGGKPPLVPPLDPPLLLHGPTVNSL